MPRLLEDRAPRLRLARVITSVALFGAVAAGGSLVLVNSSNAQSDEITVNTEVAKVLDVVDTGAPVETFLLVGSDTRACDVDKNAVDYDAICGPGAPNGRRSDTIMILRHDKTTGEAALLSLPRDLWVKISGHTGHSRLNSAYSDGTDVLVSTIQREIGIKVNHYIEVDFGGFKSLIDAVRGVEACFFYPTRDKWTGLLVAQKGCWTLDGVQGLAYARSRHFEEFRDSKWREDQRFDLGRIARQQQFMLDALKRAEDRLKSDPYALDDLVKAAKSALTVDPTVDLFKMAHRFRGLSPASVISYTLPNHAQTINDNDVLVIDTKKAQPILDYFNGLVPAPDPAQFVQS